MEGHLLAPMLDPDPPTFPFVALLVSGGHTQLVLSKKWMEYEIIGETQDDAVGEAFDKVASILGLGYPGGPLVEQTAAGGDAGRFALPRPMKGRPGCDFSFSGLKTAVRHAADALPEGPLEARDVADLCAGFQIAAAETLVDRTSNAIDIFTAAHPEGRTLVVAGGVAANAALRQSLGRLAADAGFALVAPPHHLCTDNGAMIAWAGIERINALGLDGAADGLDFRPRPRWPLDPDAAARPFAGIKA